MIRDVIYSDKDEILNMMKDFYSSPAVLHSVDESNFVNTFKMATDKSPYVRILISENENEITGYCQLSISYSNEVGGICIFIEELMIKDKFQNTGLGTEFLKFVFSSYPEAKRFRLEVTKENERAFHLYKKMGFEVLPYIQMINEVH